MNILRNINSLKKQLRTKASNLYSRQSETGKTKENYKNKLKTCVKDDILIKRGRYPISNVVGSSKDLGSKKKYWERHGKLKFSLCQVENCLNRATVGGHVWMKERTFLAWNKSKHIYITPLCQVSNWVLSHILSKKYIKKINWMFFRTCQKLSTTD